MADSCGTCFYMRRHGDAYRCHVSPPEDSGTQTWHPVAADDWCGRFSSATPDVNESCSTCFFARPDAQGATHCRVSSPQESGALSWPGVEAHDWCGAFSVDAPSGDKLQGPPGPPGPSGATGAAGPAGPQGEPGTDGIPDEAPTEGGPYGRYGGSWQPVLSNTNPTIATGWLTFGSDQSGVRFYGDGRIYKDSGGGMVLQKSSGGQPWTIEDYGAKNRANIATEPWVMSVLPTSPEAVAGVTVGDVKQGFQATDHVGWIKLDGRAITTLTVTQQTAATGLGFAENLPDATNVVPMQSNSLLGVVSGSMSRTISQANLPALTLTTTTAAAHHHQTQACTNNEGVVGFSELLAKYSQTIWRRQAETANVNNNFDFMLGRMMEDAGEHAHEVTLGGGSEALDVTPRTMSVNCFVFLGE